MNYRITGVSTVVKDKPDGRFGPAKIYRISLEGVNGPVDLFQAATSLPPMEGESIDGTVEKNEYGQYFKRDKKKSFNSPKGSYGNAPRIPNVDAMLISYAKDLLIAYMGARDWDIKKFNQEELKTYARAILKASKELLDDEMENHTESKKEVEIEDLDANKEIEDTFGIGDIDKAFAAREKERQEWGID